PTITPNGVPCPPRCRLPARRGRTSEERVHIEVWRRLTVTRREWADRLARRAGQDGFDVRRRELGQPVDALHGHRVHETAVVADVLDRPRPAARREDQPLGDLTGQRTVEVDGAVLGADDDLADALAFQEPPVAAVAEVVLWPRLTRS